MQRSARLCFFKLTSPKVNIPCSSKISKGECKALPISMHTLSTLHTWFCNSKIFAAAWTLDANSAENHILVNSSNALWRIQVYCQERWSVRDWSSNGKKGSKWCFLHSNSFCSPVAWCFTKIWILPSGGGLCQMLLTFIHSCSSSALSGWSFSVTPKCAS